MVEVSSIDANTLREWLESGKDISIVDIRPIQERSEWFIPQSIHIDAYNKIKAKDRNALKGVHLDKNIPVVTVCAGGKTSQIAAEFLNENGYEAYSLIGGMNGWSLAWNKATISFPNHQILQLRRTGKGCLSYILVSDNNAIIIDASIPSEVYKEIFNSFFNYIEILTFQKLQFQYIHNIGLDCIIVNLDLAHAKDLVKVLK